MSSKSEPPIRSAGCCALNRTAEVARQRLVRLVRKPHESKRFGAARNKLRIWHWIGLDASKGSAHLQQKSQ